MKSRLLALAMFAATLATVAFYPTVRGNALPPAPPQVPPGTALPMAPVAGQAPVVEVVFVLDTTGSMGGLIQAAKDKIWSIASTMASAQPAPELRMGLVAYRDRGDAYVTRVVDLSDDLDSVYARLMSFQAAGGGDGPESVNRALHDAVNAMSWSQDDNVYRTIFLVGDAPPHMDYVDDVKYPVSLAAARDKGIVVNTIQCGDVHATTKPWQRIARLGHGSYFDVAQAGSALAVATPFDSALATLSAELDDTRLYYGSAEEKADMGAKVAATEKLHESASDASRARRAAFNVGRSGKVNRLGKNELVDAVTSGRVDLDAIDNEALPAVMQSMAPEKQRAYVAETATKRQNLMRELKELASKRDAYIASQVAENDDAAESLDQKIYNTVRDQATSAGLEYEDGPAY